MLRFASIELRTPGELAHDETCDEAASGFGRLGIPGLW